MKLFLKIFLCFLFVGSSFANVVISPSLPADFPVNGLRQSITYNDFDRVVWTVSFIKESAGSAQYNIYDGNSSLIRNIDPDNPFVLTFNSTLSGSISPAYVYGVRTDGVLFIIERPVIPEMDIVGGAFSPVDYPVTINVYVDDWTYSYDEPEEQPIDEYRYDVTFLNNDPLSSYEMATWVYYNDGTLPIELQAQMTLEYGDSYANSGSISVLRDSGDPVPSHMQSQYAIAGIDIVYGIDTTFLATSETTASGGVVFEASLVREWIGNPGDVAPPDPIDPPVGTDPADPVTGVPGGDTSPTVTIEYEGFRDAVESALDNRELSAAELENAFQNALDKQNLSQEQIKDAMANALADQGVTSTELEKAVASGTSRGNDLVEMKLDGIKDVLDSIDSKTSTNQTAGIGDNGETPAPSGSDPLDGISTNYLSESVGLIGGMTDGFSSFVGNIILPSFPQGISTVDAISVTISGSEILIDWGQHAAFATIRTMFVWMIHIMGFMGAILIIRRGVA